ncbi:helix-turn-helix domain-containing protein [Caulobacter sp. X]|uniref:helix-turn-helix domain-containing protein n=1 Tax=Caulobacter sp. X TaxID=2048901 RepID=UPI000C1598A9|nr:helix-turn-helix domain-containing protein [Caulobacter sp. X]PIB95333.1 hypothetical protein CSW60_22580 [Caulobacter sp. X]
MQVQGLADGRGLRPINAARLRSNQLAEAYAGLPDGTDKFQIKDWLNAATSESMGIGRAAKKLLKALLETAPPAAFLERGRASGEWNEHLGLVVFKSNRALAEEMEVGEEAIRKQLKQLADAGWIAFRDSTTRKRFCQRDRASGQLLAAFGIDLRALCARADELRRLANVSEIEASQLRELQRNISALFNRLRVFAAHPEFGTHFVDQDEILRLADRMRRSRNIVACTQAYERLEARLSELEVEYLALAQDGLLETENRGADQQNSDQRTPTHGYKYQRRKGVSSGDEEADQLAADFEAAVAAELAERSRMSAEGVPVLMHEDENASPDNVRTPGLGAMLGTLPHIMERAGAVFHADMLFSDPKRTLDGYANLAASQVGLSRREIVDTRQAMGDQVFRVVALIARYKPDVANGRAYILGLRNKVSLARLAREADGVLLDLNRTWYGLYRSSTLTVLN